MPKKQFTFQERDVNDVTKGGYGKGLYDYGARMYNPATGRFLSPDTNDKDGLNRYAYVGNNPVRYNDPTGHRKDPPLWEAPLTDQNAPASLDLSKLNPEIEKLVALSDQDKNMRAATIVINHGGEMKLIVAKETGKRSVEPKAARIPLGWKDIGVVFIHPSTGAANFGGQEISGAVDTHRTEGVYLTVIAGKELAPDGTFVDIQRALVIAQDRRAPIPEKPIEDYIDIFTGPRGTQTARFSDEPFVYSPDFTTENYNRGVTEAVYDFSIGTLYTGKDGQLDRVPPNR
jgi:RHS repeat-associated protein